MNMEKKADDVIEEVRKKCVSVNRGLADEKTMQAILVDAFRHVKSVALNEAALLAKLHSRQEEARRDLIMMKGGDWSGADYAKTLVRRVADDISDLAVKAAPEASAG